MPHRRTSSFSTISPEISIILPCRNEEAALDACLTRVKEVVRGNNLNAEIIVSDSSSDSSPEIARRHGVVLVKHDKEGYGNAYLEAFKHAQGKYVFMADADGTYDFNEIPVFVGHLRKGYDMVLGNRFGGGIEKGAMSWSHRYIGNPALSFVLRLFFRANITDAHCGMRALTREALEKLDLRTSGMEFASEMIVSSLKNGLNIQEVPISYYRRLGESKLKSWRDAWRHFRFMLLYSPLYLFFIPGTLLLATGLGTLLWFYFGSPEFFGVRFHTYPMFVSSLLTFIGYQLVIFSAFAKSYAIVHLGEKSAVMERIYRYITVEKALVIGGAVLVGGMGIFILMLVRWAHAEFSSPNELKNAIVALTLLVIGIQTIFSAFMLSIIGIKNR